MVNEFFSMALAFFLVMDALGNIQAYLSLLQHFERKSWKLICLREVAISLGIMVIFFFAGEFFLRALGVGKTTVDLAGGVILFLIAIRLVFGGKEVKEKWIPGKHLVVPIATPLIASPMLFATIMIYTESELPNSLVFVALVLAWFISGIIYLFAAPIEKALKEKGLNACQRLMGLLVALIAVQMLVQGIHELVGR